MSANEIAQKLGKINFGFISATYDPKIVSEIFPSIPTPVNAKTLKISGSISPTVRDFSTLVQLVCRGVSTTTYLQNYGFGTNITHVAKYTVQSSHAPETGLIPRFWANKKIDELKLFPEIKENENLILEACLVDF